jgi:uncharacterized membrane protein YcaP (DUF421 family)
VDPSIFYQGGQGIRRTLIVGVFAYAALVLILRISGKRTLSKLNAFDFVVTVALGSTLATILLSKDVALAEGATALALLVLLQLLVTWTSVRVNGFKRLITAEPAVLLIRGEPIRAALRRERVTPDELLSAVRDRGGRELAQAEVIFLETDGSLTAILS